MKTGDKMQNKTEMLIAAVVLGLAVSAPAYAQRDPAYAAARAQGLIGETPDGFLGFVTPPTDAIKALVADNRIKRLKKYTEQALKDVSTVEEAARSAGCILVANAAIGEKYQAPDGRWMTRDENPPVLHPSCPKP